MTAPKDRTEIVKALALALSHLTVDDEEWLFPDECEGSAESLLNILEAAGYMVAKTGTDKGN